MANLHIACTTGDYSAALNHLSQDIYTINALNFAVEQAATYGHNAIIMLLYECNNDTRISWAMRRAAEYNHRHTCDFLLDLCKPDERHMFITEGFYGACDYGHIDLVHYFISLGATKWDDGLMIACSNADKALIALMVSNGACAWNDALLFAAHSNQLECVRMILCEHDDLKHEDGFGGLIYVKHAPIQKLLFEYHDSNHECVQHTDVIPLLNAGMPEAWFTTHMARFEALTQICIRSTLALRRLYRAALDALPDDIVVEIILLT
jgi:hypothetical protein